MLTTALFESSLVVVGASGDWDAALRTSALLSPYAEGRSFVVVADTGANLDEVGAATALALGVAPSCVGVVNADDSERMTALIVTKAPDVIVLSNVALTRALQSAIASAARPIAWSHDPPEQLVRFAVPVLRHPADALAMAIFLRDRLRQSQEVVFLLPTIGGREPAWRAEDVRAFLGGDASVSLRVARLAPYRPVKDLLAHLDEARIDLLTLPTSAFGGVTGAWLQNEARGSAPIALFVPGPDAPPLANIDAADLVRLSQIVGFVQTEDALGLAHASSIDEIALFSGGRRLAISRVERGRFEVDDVTADVVGLAASHEEGAREVDTTGFVRVHRPGDRPVVLVDQDVDPATLGRFDDELRDRTTGPEVWIVRLDHDDTFRSIRARFVSAEVTGVVDAGAILHDEHPDDLPDAARAIRLERVARHLEANHYVVSAVVLIQEGEPRLVPRPARRIVDRLHALTGAAPGSADTVTLQFENQDALRALLAQIDGANERIHLQTYIFEDDRLGACVADRLMQAASRGVRVRLLADAILSGHRAMGMTNPLLARLEDRSGIEVRCARMIQGVPSVAELKHRNHRKSVITDGRLMTIGGRNVGDPYFTSFEETPISTATLAPDIPWLDTGALVSGPIVSEVEAVFRTAWLRAGGDTFGLGMSRSDGGSVLLRAIVHEGLEDSNTLEAQRFICDEAVDHILVVNTFPLQLELQACLKRACARGVRVRYLVGNPRPYHGERVMFGGWTMRDIAARLVFGRLDPLVAAGADVREFAVAQSRTWQGDLGTIYPHVHAKLMSSDGRRLLMGSPNVDITSAYWEDELALLVEDPEVVSEAESAIEAWLEGGRPLTPPEEAGRRDWITRLWPSVLG